MASFDLPEDDQSHHSTVQESQSAKRQKTDVSATATPRPEAECTAEPMGLSCSEKQSISSEPETEPEGSGVGSVGRRSLSKPAWFYGNPENYQPLRWFMHLYNKDTGPTPVQRSMFDAVDFLLKNNYHFDNEERESGTLMVCY